MNDITRKIELSKIKRYVISNDDLKMKEFKKTNKNKIEVCELIEELNFLSDNNDYLNNYKENYEKKEKCNYLLLDNNLNIISMINEKKLKQEYHIRDIDSFLVNKVSNNYSIIENDETRVIKFANNNIFNFYIRNDGTVLVRNKYTYERYELKRYNDEEYRKYVIISNKKIYCDVLVIKYFIGLNESIENLQNNYIIDYIDRDKTNFNLNNLVIYHKFNEEKFNQFIKLARTTYNISNYINKQNNQNNQNKTYSESHQNLDKRKSVVLIDSNTNEVLNTYTSVNECLKSLNISKRQFYSSIKGHGKYIIKYKND